jgi:hypothetical protein
VTVQPVIASLGPGTYSATIQVRSNGASNTPRTLTVSLVVSYGGPVVQLSPATVAFAARSHSADPASRTVSVTNAGEGALARPAISVAYGAGATDWLTCGVQGDAPPYTISVALRPEAIRGLDAETYTAAVQVESAGAVGPARSIGVTLSLTPTWTVFVYGHADNARSSLLVSAIAQMSAARLDASVNVVLAADWSAGRTLPGGEAFPSGTEWLRIVGGGAAPERFLEAEQDFDSPDVLADAVARALYAFPADRYAIVLWGAGGSWLGGFGGDEHDTPADPGDDGAPMSPGEVAGAIARGLAGAGVPGPVGVVAFDGAPMMGNEVAFALASVARTLVASAELDGGGWDWERTLERLVASPGTSAEPFVAGEVEDWATRNGGPAAARTRAHAALDLTRLPAYAAAWSALATAMVGEPLDWDAIARTRLAPSPGYGLGDPLEPDARPPLRDAGRVLDGLALLASEPVAASAAEARRELDALVLARAVGDLRPAQAGVHVEATLGARWWERSGPYSLLGWDAATRWSDVLWTVNAVADVAAPDFTALPQSETAPTLVEVGSTDVDLATARLDVARDEAGHVTSFGVVAEDGAAPLALPWDGKLPELGDGAATSAVFLHPWIEGAVWLVPGKLGDGVATVDAYAVAVNGEPGVEAVALDVGGSFTVLPLGDFRGLRLTPVLWDETDGAWRPGTALDIPPSATASLALGWSDAAAGTYRLTTVVSDVWGNTAQETDVVTVPPFGG